MSDFKEPKTFDQIVAGKMSANGFDPSTGRKAGVPKPEPKENPEDLEAKNQGGEPSEGGETGEPVTPAEGSEPTPGEGSGGEGPAGEGEPVKPGKESAGEGAGGDEDLLNIDSSKPLPKDMKPEELRKGLLKDYQKKTTKLAEERRAVEQERQNLQQFQGQLQNYVFQFQQREAELVSREAQLNGMRTPAVPRGAEMTQDEKDAVYKMMGIDIDDVTDPNLLKIADFTVAQLRRLEDEQRNGKMLAMQEIEKREHNRTLDAESNDLKVRYAKLKQDLKLPEQAELMILAHLGNMRRNFNRDYTIEQATQDYIAGGGSGTESEAAFLEVVKRSPHFKKLQNTIIEEARNARVPSPKVPSSSAGGISSVTPPAPPAREKFRTIDEAAERARLDLARGTLRRSRR